MTGAHDRGGPGQDRLHVESLTTATDTAMMPPTSARRTTDTLSRSSRPDDQRGRMILRDAGVAAANDAPPADDVAQQVRRRHDAALRLPPLDDGRRDPLLARRPRMSVASARAAYFHLEACGLLSELVIDVLRREVA